MDRDRIVYFRAKFTWHVIAKWNLKKFILSIVIPLGFNFFQNPSNSERPKRQKLVSAETEISAKYTEISAEFSAETLP